MDPRYRSGTPFYFQRANIDLMCVWFVNIALNTNRILVRILPWNGLMRGDKTSQYLSDKILRHRLEISAILSFKKYCPIKMYCVFIIMLFNPEKSRKHNFSFPFSTGLLLELQKCLFTIKDYVVITRRIIPIYYLGRIRELGIF